MSSHELHLERDGFNQPWGFRMVGGADVGAPLSIARVTAGTSSEGVLKVGDIISDIRSNDTAMMSHQEASDLFTNAGNRVHLSVVRGVAIGCYVPGASALDGRDKRSAAKSRKFAEPSAEPVVAKAMSMGEFIHTKSSLCPPGTAPLNGTRSPVMLSPTSNLPMTSFIRPKTPVEQQAEEAMMMEQDEKSMIHFQPYRTTPLIMPGAKVKRDNPINSCYLSLHPDPQVRGRATHMQVTPSLNNMLHQANQQLAKKVASTANYLPMRDATDSYSGPRVVHHQFNTPINLYSNNNASQALQDRTGINTSVDGGPRKEFNIQSSAALKAILEDGAGRPAAVSQPRSHVHYDQHEAKVACAAPRPGGFNPGRLF